MNGISCLPYDGHELVGQFLKVVIQLRTFFDLGRELLKEDGLVDSIRRHLGDVAEAGRDTFYVPGPDVEDVLTVFDAVHDRVNGLIYELLELGVKLQVTFGAELGFQLSPPVLGLPLPDGTGRDSSDALNEGSVPEGDVGRDDLDPLLVGPPALLFLA